MKVDLVGESIVRKWALDVRGQRICTREISDTIKLQKFCKKACKLLENQGEK